MQEEVSSSQGRSNENLNIGKLENSFELEARPVDAITIEL